MKRKLVRQGASTMMVSLPSKWVKQNNLDKGSEIDLEEQNNNLVISSSAKSREKKTGIIEITSENKEDIKVILTHAYRTGFDKITITSADQKVKEIISNTTKNNLIGFEITEFSENKCVIENISEPTEDKYDILVLRALFIIKESYSLFFEDIESEKNINRPQIKELKEQQDKFILFCKRLLNKEKTNIFLDWELMTFLMHIEHIIYYMSEYYYENRARLNKKQKDLLKEYKEYLELLNKAYMKKDIASTHLLSKQKNKYQFGKCITLLEESKGKETVLSAYIKELFRMTQLSASPLIAELVEKYIQK